MISSFVIPSKCLKRLKESYSTFLVPVSPLVPPSTLEIAVPKLIQIELLVVNWQASVTRQLELKTQAEGIGAELDLLNFVIVWRAGYMRETKAIAAGKPGTNNVDILHREVSSSRELRNSY